ncbi:MAG: phosphoribosylformylglycinamidine cyclo-ligase [Aerococcus sp.]|nr:phosphoribosylformylglycinamidine cyclo-ligase [Aerococcus sp.]
MMSNAYQQAGVDIKKGYEAVERMRKHVSRTLRPEVLTDLGSFGALFQPDLSAYTHPVLVSGTDGVGTKILLAQQAERFDTIGIDCVAMCVNDVVAQGAEPLFFLDYLAVGENHPKQIEQLVKGVADGCVLAHAALIGGETAEMPDLYSTEEFDVAGFCVGIGERDRMFDGTQVQAGDCLIGLPSSGIHSNGYSLVRKLFFKDHNYAFTDTLSDGRLLIDHLLEPTKIYVADVLPLIQKQWLHGIAHITGGGFYENIPRMFSTNYQALITKTAWERPLIFDVMQKLGALSDQEMFNVFNMGIGMVLAVPSEHEADVIKALPNSREIGYVRERSSTEPAVVLKGLEDK